MTEFKMRHKTCNNRRLRTAQMTELQAKFQAEAAEFKALQKELQKVFLRLSDFICRFALNLIRFLSLSKRT
jgi:hypothetical protein